MTTAEASSTLALTRLSDVTPERVEWLWPGRLPVGKIVTLDGDPGLGKSTLALNIAATVTRGDDWPDRGASPAGDVLLLSAEDGLADTVRPRLDAAGADVSRVHAIEGKTLIDPDTGQTYLRPLTLADVYDLGSAMEQTGARLLIVDVLMAFLPAGTDSHKDQDIRRVLSALATAGERNRCSVLLLRHLNKSKGGDPIYRGGGSIGIVGAARSGLLVAADPDDPDRRILATVKSNLGVMPESLAYRLVDRPALGVAAIEWDGATGHSAHDLLAAEATDHADAAERTAAEHWLEDYLNENGPTFSKDVKAAASKERITERTLQRARVKLGVVDLSEGFPRRTKWALPVRETGGTTAPPLKNRGTTGTTVRDQQKQNGTTEPESQSCQGSESGTTGGATAGLTEPSSPLRLAYSEPTGGVTSHTPGMTDRVQQILAKQNALCIDCRNPVAAGQTDPDGQPAHLTCQHQRAPEGTPA